ncbi:hypothetical protein [Arsenicicoccus sp. oral taxon 190]|uniref:hypothetical protein n=1 Tax=Arsenicicoccus sp. oral taxon 190 TaxID=1658671 RepID=UPI00067A3F11|nr:hypothetical protein [Arsenicicoccus sp. oral taxon 190]AKT52156.1 hypothetical protein ADJ73_14320 [Arsenicicoccus sp. oral taxon 190]
MTTVEQVRRWSAAGVRDAGAQLSARAATLEGTAARLPLPDSRWRGDAADAAHVGLEQVRTDALAQAADVAAVAEAVVAAAGRLDQLAAGLRQLEESLRADGFELTDDGRVLDLRPCLPAGEAVWSGAERVELRTAAEGDVRALLATTDDVDQSLAHALAGIGAGTVTATQAVCRPGVLSASSVTASPASREADVRARAHQVVGHVAAHTHKWGQGPVIESARRRYVEDEAFATVVDDYGDHGDAGMLARNVLLATDDQELAQWVYTHPYDWAHEAAPFESPDGAPYVMDIPVEHSTLTEWARMATTVSNGYLDAHRPRIAREPRPDPNAQELARNRAAHDAFGKVTNRAYAEIGRKAEQIVTGHAYDKHVLGLNKKGQKVFEPDLPEMTSRAQLVDRTFEVLYDQPRIELAAGRAYHLDPVDQHIVIVNERAADGGTSFRITKEGYEKELLTKDAAQRATEGLPPTPPPQTAVADLHRVYLERNPILPERSIAPRRQVEHWEVAMEWPWARKESR